MTDTQKKKFERIEGFKLLEEGWDGFYAHPISTDVINFLQKVILTMTDNDLLRWNIFPTLNGDIILSRRFKQNGQLYFSDDNICTASALSDDGKNSMALEFTIDDNINDVINAINKIDNFFEENESKRID